MPESSNQLNIAWVQYDIQWHQPAANRDRILHLLAKSNVEPDVLFLPEMFTTGFTMQPNEVAEDVDGRTFAWMRKLAEDCQMLVA